MAPIPFAHLWFLIAISYRGGFLGDSDVHKKQLVKL